MRFIDVTNDGDGNSLFAHLASNTPTNFDYILKTVHYGVQRPIDHAVYFRNVVHIRDVADDNC